MDALDGGAGGDDLGDGEAEKGAEDVDDEGAAGVHNAKVGGDLQEEARRGKGGGKGGGEHVGASGCVRGKGARAAAADARRSPATRARSR